MSALDVPYRMPAARARFRAEVKAKTAHGSFRQWARKTYGPDACAGKLAGIVSPAASPGGAP